MEKIRVRFAPSPTGFLHVGNARTALFNWLFARQKNGVFVLRIEDTDAKRSTREYERALISDLGWLGIDWDEGPDCGGAYGPYRQSERLDIYHHYTRRLLEEEKAYYCFCSPEELEKKREKALAEGGMPVYSGKCRCLTREEARKKLKAQGEAAVRLKTPRKGKIGFSDIVRGELSFDLGLVGDPILVRVSGLPAYNYAVVMDDHLMQISHVIRGEDHIANTVRQLLVFKALGFSPPLFAHLPMVMGKDRMRLSKRHGATSVDQFSRDGILSSALFNYLALLGWAPPEGKEILERNALTRYFDLRKVGCSAAIFDYEKLHWLNRQHIRLLTPRQKAEQAAVYLKEAGILPKTMTDKHWRWLEQAVEYLIERADKFAEIPQIFSWALDFSLDDLGDEEKGILEAECAAKVIRGFSEKFSRVKKLDYSVFAELAKEVSAETGCKGRDLYHPFRVALTAHASGLDLDKIIPLIEDGAELSFPKPIKNCAARIAETLENVIP